MSPLKPSLLITSVFALAGIAAAAPPSLPLKLDFGSGKVEAGYTQVTPDLTYSDDRGFGFEPGSGVTAIDRQTADALRGDFVTSDEPFFFSVAVPDGNYKVTVTLGDAGGEASDTTVKAELRRLMLNGVKTDAGKTETRSFVVNVRTPDYPGGKVKLKVPRESVDEAWAWDPRLTLEFNGARPCVSAIEIEKIDVPTVFLLGDSTVCDQSGEPYASWGQMLTAFFKPTVAVANHGESGETLRSSTGAKRIDKVLSQMKKGDYLFIQFGHNDQKSKDADAVEQYKASLKDWVAKVKAKGGTPVLVTPMLRHRFQGSTVTNSLGDYPDKVREAAKEEGVPLIDLNVMSKSLYEALGPKQSVHLFKHEGDDLTKFDGTHHSPYGAYELAQCIVEGIRQNKLDLASHVAGDFKGFDPAKPDAPETFKLPASPRRSTTKPAGS